MEKRTYPSLGEQVYWDKLPNGLTVAVIPRPGFSKKLAYFVTDYGAIHTEFTLDGVSYKTPAGVAHFLEHKMFDLPGRDVSAEFALLGASPNAFTSYDMTAYYFSTTENFEKSLELLLEFVSTPYFTEESVAKEQGIIGQEIGMYEDSPDSRGFETLMGAMYENHPVRIPILGTRDSIARITPEILHACHKAFYRPGNMLLCVIGDVDPETVTEIAKNTLPATDTAVVTRVDTWEEAMTAPEKLVSDSMEVAMPMFQLGFKSRCPEKGEAAALREIVGELAAEALFGESSHLYLKLYEEGIIDTSFAGGYETVEGMALLLASGDSDYADQVKTAIFAETERILAEGIDEKDFLRMKRSALGRRIRDLDGFSGTIFRVCAYYFTNYDYFDFPELYRKVTVQDLLDFLKETVREEGCSMSIIYPKEEQNESC